MSTYTPIRESSYLFHGHVQHIAKYLRQLSEVRSVVWVLAPTFLHAFVSVGQDSSTLFRRLRQSKYRRGFFVSETDVGTDVEFTDRRISASFGTHRILPTTSFTFKKLFRKKFKHNRGSLATVVLCFN